MSYLYQSAILGGTFDHFHLGHEQLISAAFAKADHVTIGITKAPLSPAKAFPEYIADFATRRSSIESFLSTRGYRSRSTLIPLTDIYGTSLTDPSIEAIFVTHSTLPGARMINRERRKISLPKLSVVIVPHVLGSDRRIISSSRIRGGQIDRFGHSHRLPARLRKQLQTPIGPVITDPTHLTTLLPDSPIIIAVGDIVSRDLREAGYTPAISIIDYHTRHKPLSPAVVSEYFSTPTHELANPAGYISPAFSPLFLSALSAYQSTHTPQLIAVKGEEDLLALPALSLSPLGSVVIYGQPGLGMVVVPITESIKALAGHYLAQF